MPSLFDPIVLGDIAAPNRVLMAPLTRGRATREHVPTAIMAEYYAQRASAGLLISEGTGISREGLGWPFAPGLWTDEQVEAWKPITEAVHAAGGRIVTQLWHMGRVVHPDFLAVRDGWSASPADRPAWIDGDGGPHPDFRGDAPLSSSATTAPGQAHTYDGKKPYGQARGATLDDIARVLDDYSRAARNAKAAGFDGVQLHAANGYLIDQFLRDGANHRDDDYGGSPENRIRLLGEVVDRLIGEVGAGRTSVRFSPNGDTQGVIDSDPASVFVPAAKLLSDKGIGFLELREPGPDGTFGSATQPRVSPEIRKVFAGPLVLNQDYDGATAQAELDGGVADAIAFGRPFLANPDLPARLERGAPLNKDEMATWYSHGAEGYTDYPTLERETA